MPEEKFIRYYRLGGFVRRTWRRVLWLRDLEFDENKGWLDSVFRVRGTEKEHEELQDLVDRYNTREYER